MRTSKVFRVSAHGVRRWVGLTCVWLALSCSFSGTPPPFAPAIPSLEAENRRAGDPYAGRFPFAEAVTGLGEDGPISAVFETEAGTVHCRLDVSVPITVANFIGLARGIRPFRGSDGAWVQTPYYDDTTWHRAQVGEFVQAGRRGSLEGPGYRLQDEMSPGHVFDRGGILAMANRGGEHSGGSQFFITTNALKSLSGQYTIFGTCDDEHVVRELERRVVAGSQPALRRVTISRGTR